MTPEKNFLDQLASGEAHVEAEAVIGKEGGEGLGDGGGVAFADEACAGLADLGADLDLVGDDDGGSGGHGFGNGDAEVLLFAGEAEAGGINEEGILVTAVDGAGEMDAIGNIQAGGELQEIGSLASVGSGDDELNIRELSGNGCECVHKKIGTLLVVKTTEEGDEGAAAECGILGEESSLFGEEFDVLEEDAVWNDVDGDGEAEAFHEAFDVVGFILTGGVDEGGVTENITIKESESDVFFEGLLLEGPGVEHAGGADNVGDAHAPSKASAVDDGGVPCAMGDEHIGMQEVVAESATEISADHAVNAAALGEEMVSERDIEGDALEHGEGAFPIIRGVIPDDGGVVTEPDLGGGEIDGDSWRPPGAGVQRVRKVQYVEAHIILLSGKWCPDTRVNPDVHFSEQSFYYKAS